MKKLILSLIFVVLLAGVACAGSPIQAVIARKNAGGVACSSATDSEIVLSGVTNDSTTASAYMRAWQFSVAAEKSVTGLTIYAADGGSGYQLTGQIWTDVTGSPGAIYGAGFTGAVANLPDTQAKVELLFAETQTLPIGTYWAVFGPAAMTLGVSGSSVTYGINSAGSGTFKYDNAGSWAPTGNEMYTGVLGCD